MIRKQNRFDVYNQQCIHTGSKTLHMSKMVNWFFEFDSKGDYIYEVDIAGG